MANRPDFAVEVFSPNTADVVHGRTDDWVELLLDFSELAEDGEPERTQRLAMTRDAAELIIDQLHEFLHPWAGKTISDSILKELIEVSKRLSGASRRGARHGSEDVGLARGLARALAILRNPYDPDAAYEAVKIEVAAVLDLEEDR